MNEEIKDIYLKIGNALTEGKIIQSQIKRKRDALATEVNELGLMHNHVGNALDNLWKMIYNLTSTKPDIDKIMAYLNDYEEVIRTAKEEL